MTNIIKLTTQLVLFTIVILFTNCGKTDPVIEEEECLTYGGDVLMPIYKGNNWINELSRYTDGQISNIEPDTFITSISQTITIYYDNVSYEVGVRDIHNISEPSTYLNWLYWNGPDGLYFMGGIAGSDTLLTKVLNYKYPVEPGESWLVPLMAYDGSFFFKDTLQYLCVAIDEQIESTMGEFETIIYQFSRRQAEDVLARRHHFKYFTPGIGIVEEFIYSTEYDTISYNGRKIEDLKYKITLFDYCLK